MLTMETNDGCASRREKAPLRGQRRKAPGYAGGSITSHACTEAPSGGLGASVMESQLSNQQSIAFDSIHHAVLVSYAA